MRKPSEFARSCFWITSVTSRHILKPYNLLHLNPERALVSKPIPFYGIETLATPFADILAHTKQKHTTSSPFIALLLESLGEIEAELFIGYLYRTICPVCSSHYCSLLWWLVNSCRRASTSARRFIREALPW